MRLSISRSIALAGLLALGATATNTPAVAAGCGGYVNVFVSGCAPWDNNPRRMPGAPGYQAPRPTTPTIQRTTTVLPPQTSMTRPVIAQQPNRLITDNGAGLLSPGNRNPGIISNDGGGLRNRSGILSDQGGGMRR
ncbi:MAG: hypothetical protein JNK84_18715 [Phreatobacter sp.]|uniref:hypothetical protein n=1 Tax=Phreatobacter sp. TaxID=1966341 RepID=UPI001A3BBF9F|nr:hypothetical protein [Phreatobacter sp.]MBL8571110.1 hypothetical protein [Phreatobacter sp.]